MKCSEGTLIGADGVVGSRMTTSYWLRPIGSHSLVPVYACSGREPPIFGGEALAMRVKTFVASDCDPSFVRNECWFARAHHEDTRDYKEDAGELSGERALAEHVPSREESNNRRDVVKDSGVRDANPAQGVCPNTISVNDRE